jgi:hypothetical protein
MPHAKTLYVAGTLVLGCFGNGESDAQSTTEMIRWGAVAETDASYQLSCISTSNCVHH